MQEVHISFGFSGIHFCIVYKELRENTAVSVICYAVRKTGDACERRGEVKHIGQHNIILCLKLYNGHTSDRRFIACLLYTSRCV